MSDAITRLNTALEGHYPMLLRKVFMHRMLFATAATVALLALPIASTLHAQSDAPHSIIGSWTLNHERSSFEPGPGPQAQTRRFLVDDEGFIISIRATVNPNGNPDFALARVEFDGQPYEVWPAMGLGNFLATGTRPTATAAFEAIDERTVRLTQRNAEGEIMGVGPNTWSVSSDGNTLTVTTSGVNQAGVTVNNVEVFDRVQN